MVVVESVFLVFFHDNYSIVVYATHYINAIHVLIVTIFANLDLFVLNVLIIFWFLFISIDYIPTKAMLTILKEFHLIVIFTIISIFIYYVFILIKVLKHHLDLYHQYYVKLILSYHLVIYIYLFNFSLQ